MVERADKCAGGETTSLRFQFSLWTDSFELITHAKHFKKIALGFGSYRHMVFPVAFKV